MTKEKHDMSYGKNNTADRPKKIAIFLGANATGGAERVACTLAEEWLKQGIEAYLITLYPPYKTAYPVDSNVKQYYLFPERKYNKVTIFFGSIFRLRKIVKMISPDAVLSLIIRYNLLALIALSWTGVRLVVSDRDNPYFSHGFFQDFMRKLLYRFADGVISPTSEAKDVLMKITKNKNYTVILNPLNRIFLHDPSLFSKKNRRIISVGRMISTKNQRLLLSAFSTVAPLYPDWELMLVGDGPEFSNLVAYTKELGLEKRVVFAGNCSNVPELLLQSEIFAFSSNTEGLGNALLEALSCGLPCVSTNCPVGPSDLVKDGENGFLVPVNDVDEFGKKLNILMSNEELRKRFSQNALDIRKRLDPVVISKQYADFLLHNLKMDLS